MSQAEASEERSTMIPSAKLLFRISSKALLFGIWFGVAAFLVHLVGLRACLECSAYTGLTYGALGFFFAVAMTVLLLSARRGRMALFTNRVRRPSSSGVAGIAGVWGAIYLLVALAAQLSPPAALLTALLEFGFIFVSAKLLALLYRAELGWWRPSFSHPYRPKE
jgi:hypothetical protein